MARNDRTLGIRAHSPISTDFSQLHMVCSLAVCFTTPLK
uniref:Uncharacterized protein n=1 Tax=Anguilla anguilla TaxID=7936 RepID=A0A0E9VD41_ANGAN